MKGEFPGFCKTGFGVGNKGCAIVRLETEDVFLLIVPYRNVSAALSLPNKVKLHLFQSK
jgi:hypothetical protein